MSKFETTVNVRCPIKDIHGNRCDYVHTVAVSVVHDRGVRTFSNGDPGYPPSWDISYEKPQFCSKLARCDYFTEQKEQMENEIEEAAIAAYEAAEDASYWPEPNDDEWIGEDGG